MADAPFIEFRDVKIPLKIKQEWRRSVRYSISKKSINLTVPRFYSKEQIQNEFDKIRKWSYKQFRQSPNMLERFIPRQYSQDEIFEIYGDRFTLNFILGKRKTLSGQIEKDLVIIKAPDDLDSFELNNNTGQLLSRLFSKYYLPDVKRRVLQLNASHFNENVKNVSLKNNQSNWGSCSSNRNINLASRLLFAPGDVLDYVIIHELAHLKEMNHSKKFWSIVEKAMPDYRKKESWLTKNGSLLKF